MRRNFDYIFFFPSNLEMWCGIEALWSQKLNEVKTRLSHTYLLDRKCPNDNGELHRRYNKKKLTYLLEF